MRIPWTFSTSAAYHCRTTSSTTNHTTMPLHGDGFWRDNARADRLQRQEIKAPGSKIAGQAFETLGGTVSSASSIFQSSGFLLGDEENCSNQQHI
jgi:hypothetical protein